MNFCEKKNVIKALAQSLIELSKMYILSCSSNVANILPCGNTVRKGVIKLSGIINSKFKSILANFFHYGGGLSWDVEKIE